MKTLPLSKNYAERKNATSCMFAIVDDKDYGKVSRFNWHKHKCEHNIYAATYCLKPRRLQLHKYILKLNNIKINKIVYFRNGNTLDCRKENIYSPLKKVHISHVPQTIEEKRKYWRDYCRHKRNNDVNFKIKDLIRGRIYSILKNKKAALGINLHKQFNEIVGCDLLFFKEYINSKFKSGMAWDNHGKVWQLDHILPCASFDLMQDKQLKACFHYTNYQPLYNKENMSKNKRMLM